MRNFDDISAAQDRAEMIFAILRQPLEHCGYGLPKKAADYKNAFSIENPPFDWPGALSIDTAHVPFGTRENGICRIAYAVQSGIRTMSSSATSSDILKVTTNELPPPLKGEANGNDKEHFVANWMLFGAMMPYCLPLLQNSAPMKNYDGSYILSLMFNRYPSDEAEISIPENDELFYLRVMECMVTKWNGDFVFVTNDCMRKGGRAVWQPRVDGVIDVRFEMGERRRFIRVWTLTRGNNRYGEIVTPEIPQGWPEKYAGGIPEEARHYRLMSYSASFALKNL
jgi:hypothetical protein